MRRSPLTLALAAAFTAGFLACGDDGLLQGDDYRPDGVLPIAPASERIEGGTRCEGGVTPDGGACDAGTADVQVVPLGDASTEPSNTCQTARAIGTMAGDLGSPALTAQGTCSEYISLRATEDSSSALGATMKTTLTLTPVGGDFDLYVFFDPVRDVRACTAPFARSVASGTTPETVALTWGEGSVANGSDDGRTIGVAVFKAGGACGPDAGRWTFRAEGNR